MSETVTKTVVAKGDHVKFKQMVSQTRNGMAEDGLKDIKQVFDPQTGTVTLTGYKP